MKKALIIHGWDGNPNEPLHEYLKEKLENLNYQVVIPEMPNPETPVIESWVDRISEIFNTSYDILIGHSIGCQAILRFMETLEANSKVSKVILIAPWMELDMNTIKEEGKEIVEMAKPWMETPIDFKKVKEKADKFIAIFSDNDSYVPLSQADFFKKNLKAEVFIENNQGHFTESDSFQNLQTDINSIIS